MLQAIYVFMLALALVALGVSLYPRTSSLGRFISLPFSFIFFGITALKSGSIETVSNGEVIAHSYQGLMWLWFGFAMIVFVLLMIHFVSYFKTSLGGGRGVF